MTLLKPVLGIVVALQDEAAVLTDQKAVSGQVVAIGSGCCLYLSGMGSKAAHNAAEALVAAGASHLAVLGVSGALIPEVPNGALLCPAEVCTASGLVYATDTQWRACLVAHLRQSGVAVQADGRLFTADTALADAAAKQRVYEQSAAQSVDMESAAVAAVAWAHHRPFLVLRAVVDECDDVLPESLLQGVDAFGRPQLWPTLRAVLRNPWAIRHAPRLASRMRRALSALRSAVAVVGPDLAVAKLHSLFEQKP